MNHPKSFLLVEDHYIVAWALKNMIEQAFEGATVESVVTFEEAIKQVKGKPTDLVILDIGLPDGQSVNMIRRLLEAQPGLKVLVYSGLPEDEYSVKALSIGASGFVSKDQPVEVVKEAITTVLSNRKYISKLSYEAIAESFLDSKPTHNLRAGTVHLTSREKDVLTLLLRGKWTKEIANELELKVTTVSTHKTHIFEKFGVTNSIDLFKVVQDRMPQLIGK